MLENHTFGFLLLTGFKNNTCNKFLFSYTMTHVNILNNYNGNFYYPGNANTYIPSDFLSVTSVDVGTAFSLGSRCIS